MRLYKITATDDNFGNGNVVAWAGTQADAKAEAKTMQTEFESETKPVITEVDFPTDKPGLLTYLNLHFARDNG